MITWLSYLFLAWSAFATSEAPGRPAPPPDGGRRMNQMAPPAGRRGPMMNFFARMGAPRQMPPWAARMHGPRGGQPSMFGPVGRRFAGMLGRPGAFGGPHGMPGAGPGPHGQQFARPRQPMGGAMFGQGFGSMFGRAPGPMQARLRERRFQNVMFAPQDAPPPPTPREGKPEQGPPGPPPGARPPGGDGPQQGPPPGVRPPGGGGPTDGPPGDFRPREGRPGMPLWARVIDRIQERRPELAERLRRILHESPEKLDEMLANVLMERLERMGAPDGPDQGADERSGAPQGRRPRMGPGPMGPGPMGPRPGMGGQRPPLDDDQPPGPPGPAGMRPGRAPGGGGMPVELRARVMKLREREEALGAQTRELADHARKLSEKDGEEAQAKARREIEKLVSEQFKVRMELRHVELERLELELKRINEALDRIRDEMMQRESDHDEIIRQRVEEMLGGN